MIKRWVDASNSPTALVDAHGMSPAGLAVVALMHLRLLRPSASARLGSCWPDGRAPNQTDGASHCPSFNGPEPAWDHRLPRAYRVRGAADLSVPRDGNRHRRHARDRPRSGTVAMAPAIVIASSQQHRQADRLRVEPRDAVPDPREAAECPRVPRVVRAAGPYHSCCGAFERLPLRSTGTRQPSARRVLLIRSAAPDPGGSW